MFYLIIQHSAEIFNKKFNHIYELTGQNDEENAE